MFPIILYPNQDDHNDLKFFPFPNISEDNWIKKTVKDSKENKLPENIENFSILKLKNILKKLVNEEEYEKAVRVRDLIAKKNI